MKASLALCLVLVLAACSHVRIDARSDSRPPASGASMHVHGGSLAAVILAGMLIAGTAEDIRNPQAVPVMQPDRAVSEQDCTKPIELGDNLRCR